MNIGDRFPHIEIEVVEGEVVSPDEELSTDQIEGISLDSDELLGEDLEPGYGETETELELAHTINQLTGLTGIEQTFNELYDVGDWIE